MTYYASITLVSGLTVLLVLVSSATCQTPAASLASSYSLTTSTALPFPTSTMASEEAQKLLVADWGLGKGRIQDGETALAFVADPFPDHPVPGFEPASDTAPVLRVTYPAGSFSHDTGGVQFYNLWNDTASAHDTTSASSSSSSYLASSDVGFGSLLLEYEIAFDETFD